MSMEETPDDCSIAIKFCAFAPNISCASAADICPEDSFARTSLNASTLAVPSSDIFFVAFISPATACDASTPEAEK